VDTSWGRFFSFQCILWFSSFCPKFGFCFMCFSSKLSPEAKFTLPLHAPAPAQDHNMILVSTWQSHAGPISKSTSRTKPTKHHFTSQQQTCKLTPKHKAPSNRTIKNPRSNPQVAKKIPRKLRCQMQGKHACINGNHVSNCVVGTKILKNVFTL
jgi:hypothetical protein